MQKLENNGRMNCFPLNDNIALFLCNQHQTATDMKFQILKDEKSAYQFCGNDDAQYFTPKFSRGHIYVTDQSAVSEWLIDSVNTVQKQNPNSGLHYVEVVNGNVVDQDFTSNHDFFCLDEGCQIPLYEGFLVSWLDKSFHIDYENGIVYKVLENMQEEKVAEVAKKSYSIYFQCGLLQLNDNMNENIFLFDALNSILYANVSSEIFSRYRILKNTELTPFGMKFKDRLLLKVMGSKNLGKYLKELEIYYDEWRSQFFGLKEFPLGKVNNILIQLKEEPIDELNIHLDRFRFRGQVQLLQSKGAQLQEQIVFENEQKCVKVKDRNALCQKVLQLCSAVEGALK